MKLIILKDKKQATKTAAYLIAEEINKNPNLVLGFATGKTMIPVYKELVKLNKRISFSKIKTFNLDEYKSLSPKSKLSLRYYMNKNLFNKADIKKENINFLNGKEKNIKKMCKNYEIKIREYSIDLQILGIGKNAHIGFNEPGSSFKSKTREVNLSKSTMKSNRKMPEKAMTMGISTIMKAKKIILIATGKAKAKAIYNTLNKKVAEKVPASILKKHRDITFILDKTAASRLSEP